MRMPLLLGAAMLACATLAEAASPASQPVTKWVLAIHGGAGVIKQGDLSAQKEIAYRAGLNAALAASSTT